ncbi:T9SS C-terminal target domain-containing protein [Flavobacterium circumlabens]|uniref:Repeat protein (TIGR01451 family)/predicted secreted protein (Por secretion system target) n=1 Tax=Flavobacterium circumlabens TaxID=2133765 RepID=A0A4Y7U9Y4_9FLAO|nr:T9SS type A sorting domain-containing protein [Flavobacterium circumlabens]TCN55545.1 putative repeat protein (TIGR01451 family)/predicted secreted protein (Por secretion system target) [Flavobacterium circumlabens]TEB43051.1 T9SS C-terminal target domain-containing protein [Flavobacterium circumlabens]
MTKNYFLLLALCFLSSVNAQIINIPGALFKAQLQQANETNNVAKDINNNPMKIDLNNDTEIDADEASKVYSLNIIGSTSLPLYDLTGIKYFKNLTYLYCADSYLTSLDLSGLNNLKELVCSRSKIESIDLKGLTSLEKLDCYSNSITSLDISDCKNLKVLTCLQNSLYNLDTTGLLNLESIDCSQNKIKILIIPFLDKLIDLKCNENQIEALDFSGISNLMTLDCSSNNLKTVNVSNLSKLSYFKIRKNKLDVLDVSALFNLETFACGENFLTSLNISKNQNIKDLECGGNLYTSIDLSGHKKLFSLRFNYSNISSVNLKNCESLMVFDCTDNQLISLDVSDCKNLSQLDCSFNKLKSLYIKNGISYNYYYFFNFNPTLKYICADEIEVMDFQNRVNNLGYNCIVNSYCSFNPGGTYYTISGNQKYDSDNNGCDISDTKLPNLNFNITDGTLKGNIISDESGNYSISVGEGTHTITPILEDPNYYEVSPESLVVTFPTQTSPFTQNFCVTPKGEHQDIEITILSTVPARPGFDATYKIVYKNKANKTVSGSVTLDFNDAVLDYVAASPSITNQTTNKLVWDYTNLKALETREINVTLNVNSPMETPAVNINDRLSFNALITPVTGDEKPVDNSFAMRQTVVGSFDPNDKTCLEGDVITPELIGEYVHYLIRFENTGTYPAENIVVKDMIDLSKFDISTLVPTSASHSYTTKISEGNKVEFIFEKIDLPFNDAYNDGYIAFKIKTLPTLKTGDSFTNEANIYFDYNFPILTNKATSTFKTLGTQDFEFSKYFNIYPNPAQNVLNISIKNDATIKSIAVYDVLGQLVIAVPNAVDVSTIDVSKLRTGNYILKIKTDNGTSGVKFIKL